MFFLHTKHRSVCAFNSFLIRSQAINHPAKTHTVISVNNRQEIINVLNMKKHMVFRNWRKPVGEARETRGESGQPASQQDCAQNMSLGEGGCCYCSMAATAQLQQQVWKSDREQSECCNPPCAQEVLCSTSTMVKLGKQIPRHMSTSMDDTLSLPLVSLNAVVPPNQRPRCSPSGVMSLHRLYSILHLQ